MMDYILSHGMKIWIEENDREFGVSFCANRKHRRYIT
nr:MAG TPA: hypothetical protein [Bacteriophage sp.]